MPREWRRSMVLTLVAAPLVVLGLPFATLGRLLPDAARVDVSWLSGGRLHAVAGFAFAIALWTWHVPGPYDATLRSDLVYWIMHVTTFGAALLLWHALFLHLEHFGTTWPWGLSPLDDQQLGGLIMWVPGGTLFTLYSLIALGIGLQRIAARESNLALGS